MTPKQLLSIGIALSLAVGVSLLAWMLNWVDFFSPVWLLLLLLLPFFVLIAATGKSGLPPKINAFSLACRGCLFVLLVLALGDIRTILRRTGICVMYLIDHSASVPQEISEESLSYANETAKRMGKEDRAGILVFGEDASVEILPQEGLQVDALHSYVERDQTDLQEAVELAVAAMPKEYRKKIVLLSDGNETEGDLMAGARFALSHQVNVDVLPVHYDYKREVLVERLVLPEGIQRNETFDLKVVARSLQICDAQLTILRNEKQVAQQTVRLKKGVNSFRAPMKISEAGFHVFSALLTSKEDTLKENNRGLGSIYVQGEARILFVANDPVESEHLISACSEEGLETEFSRPGEMPDSLSQLQNYDCVILANVPSYDLTDSQMQSLHAAVRDMGIGLMMVGGEHGFGAGGYEGTLIEEALPVSMDISQKKINPKGALVLILHTCEFPDGNYWAKEISKRAISTLNRADEVGVLLYNMGGENWLFPLTSAEDKEALYAEIDQAQPGDMPSFEPTLKMALASLSQSDAMVKHVIVISDGDPARPSPELIEGMADAGITVSTVAINPHTPRDVDVMKYIAAKTQGRYYFAADPRALPKIFSKEAKVVKRSLIFSEEFQPALIQASELTRGVLPQEVPTLQAYVATTAKPVATVPMVSTNENQDPILAHWRYGLGKTVAFTSDATTNWGRNWVAWDKYKKVWTQIIRWVARERTQTPLRMRAEVRGGEGRLVIDAVDAQGEFMNFLRLNGRVVGPDRKGTSLDLKQVAPGRYEAAWETNEDGIYMMNVGSQDPVGRLHGFSALGVAVPYSQEYKELESDFSLLAETAHLTNGTVLQGDPNSDRVFEAPSPPVISFGPLQGTLLGLVLMLFCVDIFLRRVLMTREDLGRGLERIGRILGRRERKERDAMMEALLERKARTGEELSEGRRSRRKFAEELQRRSLKRKDVSSPELEGLSLEAKETLKEADLIETEEQDSYTRRLLDAKRRAHEKQNDKGEEE